MIINPRKPIYPQSGYPGILFLEEGRIKLLEKAFYSLLQKSPFEREIHKYYLTHINLCTNIRCDNKKVFRERVGKRYPDQPYHSYAACLDAIERSRFLEQTQSDMRTLVTQMQRKQTIDAALYWMEKHSIQTDGLLSRFAKLGIRPIPLRQDYAAERMPSLPEILREVGEKPVSIVFSLRKRK